MTNVYESATHQYDDLLFTGQMPVVTDTIAIPAESTLTRGSVITKDGTLVTTGQPPYGIMAETIITADEPAEAAAYLMGEFNASSLIVGGESTVEDFKVEMRNIGLILRNVQNGGNN